MKTQIRIPGLLLFALLSCAAHAALLYALTTGEQSSLQLSGQPVQVTLLPSSPALTNDSNYRTPSAQATTTTVIPKQTLTETTAVPVKTPAQPAAHSTEEFSQPPALTTIAAAIQQTATAAATQQPVSTNKPLAASTPITIDAATPTQIASTLQSQLKSQLKSRLLTYFHYPRLAQRRNWQGLVQLNVRVEANGVLSHIAIQKSSGYSILDQAAMNSLKQIAALPDAEHWLQGNSFDTVLPVNYQLIDS